MGTLKTEQIAASDKFFMPNTKISKSPHTRTAKECASQIMSCARKGNKRLICSLDLFRTRSY